MSEIEDTLNDPAAMAPTVVVLAGRLSPLPGPPQVVYESTPTGDNRAAKRKGRK